MSSHPAKRERNRRASPDIRSSVIADKPVGGVMLEVRYADLVKHTPGPMQRDRRHTLE